VRFRRVSSGPATSRLQIASTAVCSAPGARLDGGPSRHGQQQSSGTAAAKLIGGPLGGRLPDGQRRSLAGRSTLAWTTSSF
jgi:hypothetical protein